MFARTVAQDVPVVACGQRLSAQHAEGEKDNGYHTITLLATPHNAELIELAANTTRTRMVLRGVGDKSRADSDGVSFAELRGHVQSDDTPSPVIGSAPSVPTTQPTMSVAYPASSARLHHTTELIRAGAVTKVDFQFPSPSSNTMTDTPNSPAVAQ
jgi:Flp pilus assembly protein CpaB